MGEVTPAWLLRSGAETGPIEDIGAALQLERYELPEMGPGDCLVEPLLVSWEGNLDHALRRQPIDVCSTRRDSPLVLGNIGLVRVLRSGDAVTALGPPPTDPAQPRPAPVTAGQLALVLPFGTRDDAGYAPLIWGYDCPKSGGLLARRTIVPADLLLPLPKDSRWPLPRWAAYGRYFTAWDNWRVAYGCWRVQMPEADPGDHLVFAWGGGVALAWVTWAQRHGFTAALAYGQTERLTWLTELGLVPIDRRDYPGLAEPEAGSPDGYGTAHRRARRDFARRMEELSGGRGVALLLDNVGQPLYPTTLAALGRQGVVTTCGWKAGMRLSQLRAVECQRRHLHVHTHLWRHQDSPAIRDAMEATGWLAPAASLSLTDFEGVPELARDYSLGRCAAYTPLVRIND